MFLYPCIYHYIQGRHTLRQEQLKVLCEHVKEQFPDCCFPFDSLVDLEDLLGLEMNVIRERIMAVTTTSFDAYFWGGITFLRNSREVQASPVTSPSNEKSNQKQMQDQGEINE